jgi:hypothetical protein
MSEKKTRSISIDFDLFTEINQYCKANNLKVMSKIEEMLRKQFIIEKWGEIPSIFMPQENELDESEKDKPIIETKKIEIEKESTDSNESDNISNVNINNKSTKSKIRRLK